MLILGMICGDGEVTLGSTLTALAIPTSNPKKKQNQVFIYKFAPKGILDGAKMARDTKAVVRNFYEDVDDIPSMLTCDKPAHLTFYFLTCDPNGGQIPDLPTLFSNPKFRLGRTGSNIKGITIMLDDRNGLGRIGPHKLGYLDHMESLHGRSFLSETFGKLRGGDVEVRCIVAGSWYDSFGHQGGYVTGHKDTIEALTWDAKAFFFSTPPMPLQAQMTDKAIEILQRKRDQAYVDEEKLVEY
jgi:serine palmitoyltransferase